MCDETYGRRLLAKVEACVGVGIYSVKLTYSDGSASPLLGTRKVTASVDLPHAKDQDQTDGKFTVQVRAWGENYLQSILFKRGQEVCGKLEATSDNGTLTDFALG